jgi:peptidoglycan/LPS O-acetylase OafA/YrhL
VTTSEHELPPFEDPGKEDRSAHHIPVVPEFDGYRAFAIFGIVCMHLLLISKVTSGAGTGLDGRLMVAFPVPWLISLLFIVSGFVVFLPTVARNGEFGDVGAYAIRRAARLLPAFWVTMVILLVIVAAEPALPSPGWDEVLVNFAGQAPWASVVSSGFSTGFGLDGPIWSLTVEISFYIVLPLVASAYWRRPLVGLAIAAAVSVLWRIGLTHVTDLADLIGIDLSPSRAQEIRSAAHSQFPGWAFAFGAGMTAAWAFVNLPGRFDRRAIRRSARFALMASVVALAICAYFSSRHAPGLSVISAGYAAEHDIPLFLAMIGSIAAAMLALSLSGLPSPFRLPAARRLGDISYGVFLIHFPIITCLALWTGIFDDPPGVALLVSAAIVLPLSIAYGYLSARFVEQPIRRWARRFGRRGAEPAGVAPAPAKS